MQAIVPYATDSPRPAWPNGWPGIFLEPRPAVCEFYHQVAFFCDLLYNVRYFLGGVLPRGMPTVEGLSNEA